MWLNESGCVWASVTVGSHLGLQLGFRRSASRVALADSADPGTYDAWAKALQAVDPRFGFSDPPFPSSLPLTLAFAAVGDRPAAVLTGPSTVVNGPARLVRSRPAVRPRWAYSTIR